MPSGQTVDRRGSVSHFVKVMLGKRETQQVPPGPLSVGLGDRRDIRTVLISYLPLSATQHAAEERACRGDMRISPPPPGEPTGSAPTDEGRERLRALGHR